MPYRIPRTDIPRQNGVRSTSRFTFAAARIPGSRKPNRSTVHFVRSVHSRHIAEIGCGTGTTSIKLAKYLNNEGSLSLFDFTPRVEAVRDRLVELGYKNVTVYGCSTKILDSYNWNLMKLIKAHKQPVYDYVYIDGAHTWSADGLAFFLVDRLLKIGGYVDFDDYSWKLSKSPTLKPAVFPAIRELYTKEQIDMAQIKLVVDLLVRRDCRYREVRKDKIFQKLK